MQPLFLTKLGLSSRFWVFWIQRKNGKKRRSRELDSTRSGCIWYFRSSSCFFQFQRLLGRSLQKRIPTVHRMVFKFKRFAKEWIDQQNFFNIKTQSCSGIRQWKFQYSYLIWHQTEIFEEFATFVEKITCTDFSPEVVLRMNSLNTHKNVECNVTC